MPMLRSLAAILAGALLLCALPALHGRPAVYFDTKAYYLVGQQIGEIAGLARPGSAVDDLRGDRPVSDAEAREHARRAYTIAGARSPYYSFFLFGLERLGGLWAVVAAQALLAAAVLHRLARLALPGGAGAGGYLALMAGLGALSTLPVFAGYMMADFFTGLAVAVAALLLLFADRIGRGEKSAWWLLLAAAGAFHLSNVLLVGSLAALWGLVGLLRPSLRRLAPVLPGVLLVGTALAASVAAGVAYGAAVRVVRGETLRSPPFLSARLIADGPGRDYLRRSCAAGEPWAMCRFQHQPLDDSQQMLWESQPGRSVFPVSDYDTRVALIAEQTRFVLAVLRHDPLGVIGSSLRNFWEQLFSTRLTDTLTDPVPYLRDPSFALFARIVPDAAECLARPDGCARLPPGPVGVLMSAVAALSVLGIGLGLWRLRARAAGRWSPQQARLAALALGVLAVLLVNAAISGALSGPFPRYQTRVLWLAPLAAALLWWWLRRDAARATAPAA